MASAMAASAQSESFPSSGRQALMRRFADLRGRTAALAAPLSAEDQAIQSMPDASPTKWHLAHTTWFFETFILKKFVPHYAPFDERYGYLFNSYYEGEGARHPRPMRGMLSRPSLEEIVGYRASVDEAVAALAGDLSEREWRSVAPIFELGLAHEEQHQELILMDIKYLFSLNPLRPSYGAKRRAAETSAPALEWRSFPGGVYEIGAGGEGFSYDNERPRHREFLEPFRLASRLVTNAEFEAFIEDGGYRRSELWLSDGWAAVLRESGWTAPLYWSFNAGTEFTLAGERTLDPDEPVIHVSYFEADAFARWAHKRLPREAEWEVAASKLPVEGHFASTGEFHPRPAMGRGVTQMFGDAWEWTSSAYDAYPGFRPTQGALGEYNGKFMCGQYLLRGGSAVTSDGHVRATYRNFYPPAARWAFSGIRLADDDA